MVINVGLGLVIAAMLARVWKARLLIPTCIVLPVVISPMTVATIWRWMYQSTGVINQVLDSIGLGALATPWLGSPDAVLYALALAHSWSTIGLSAIIFLAGLRAVDEDLYEVARVDGANPLQSLRYVTLPGLRPVTAVVFILTLTQSFKVFDIVWATTQDGPIRFSEILSTYMYKRGALENQYGYGSAIGVALLVIVSSATILYMQIQNREERYMIRWLLLFVLGVIAILMISPLILTVFTSLKPTTELVNPPWYPPINLTFEHYARSFGLLKALFHKLGCDCTFPLRGQACPAGPVTGVPRAVWRLRTATRTWISATCRSKSGAMRDWPGSLMQFILAPSAVTEPTSCPGKIWFSNSGSMGASLILPVVTSTARATHRPAVETQFR